MRQAIQAAAVLSLAAASYGQEFIAIDIGPKPNILNRFDITNVPATLEIGAVVGDFTRGMVLDGPMDGWYIATESGGGPTGFFRLDSGVSTKIADMPFITQSVGGMAFSADKAHLWVVLDPPGLQPCTLYNVSFAGVWNAVDFVNVPGNVPVINGIATDPTTGKLYGVDTESDYLIEIDTATAAATKIGAGLGFDAWAVGGMDFTPDNRLYYISGREVYPVSTSTGTAGKLSGKLPFFSSSLVSIKESSCYADCDRSTGVGVFDVFDFLCFQDAFVRGSPYACRCDTSTGIATCDVFDFLCFQNAFVAGCP